jgi:hypothetical protein
MLPVIQAFMTAHQLPDVTVVADAGMVSEANQKAVEAAGLSFILGAKIPHEPYVVKRWRRQHPGQDIPDRQVFTQPWPAGPDSGRRDQVIYYQYRHARRTLRGIDEQVRKAEQAVAGKVAVKRNRFIRLTGGTRTVNRELEAKARALAGLKGYADVSVMPRSGGSGPGDARVWGGLIGIITGSGARRSAGRRGGSPRRGCRVGGSGQGRRA